MSSLVHKKIRFVLEMTEFDASLLVGLCQREANQARQARNFVSANTPNGKPLPALTAWERIAETVTQSVTEAEEVAKDE